VYVETHEAWLEDKRYIGMDLLREELKAHLRKATYASAVTNLLPQFDEHNALAAKTCLAGYRSA
jgi:hypothetical protein